MKLNRNNRFTVFLILLVLSASGHAAKVLEVHSGDSLTLQEGSRAIRLTLANVDAPELDQPYGKISRKTLENLCKGKEASYRKQGKSTDGKILASIVCDGTDVERAQLRKGMAWVRPRPDIDAAYTLIQDFVWRDKIGLWADADPVPPWEWSEKKK